MDRVIYHVVPDLHHVGRHWKVEKPVRPGHPGGEEAERHIIRIFLTKHDAVFWAKETASGNCPSQVIVHGVDGRFEEEFVY